MGIILTILFTFAVLAASLFFLHTAFRYADQKDTDMEEEVRINTRRGQERVNIDDISLAMAEMAVESYLNTPISIFWTEQMADKLEANESQIKLKVANYIRGAMYRKSSVNLSDKETSTVSALVVYYALGYDDFYDSKQDLLNDIISAYSNNDFYGILQIQSCARYHAEHQD